MSPLVRRTLRTVPLLAGVLVTSLLAIPTAALGAQQPTAAQAQALLQARPDLVQQLRQRLQTSGLTPAQVRARLKAEGYPETLLDAYLPHGPAASAPTADVFRAVRALGVSDTGDVAALERATLGQRGTAEDSLALDTLRVADSATTSPDSGFVVFGRSLFTRATSEFAPETVGPVDPSYRLGPGDQLVLVLSGDFEASYELDVTREGFVVIPMVGTVPVTNLTLSQLEDVLYTRLGAVYSGLQRGPDATTRFALSVARLRTTSVVVIGDVVTPGSYRIGSLGSVFAALYAAGGPTDRGSFRRVDVRRQGRTVATIDLYDYLVRGDASRDVRLQSGDIVFVPAHGPQVRLVGEVHRPATYEVLPGETLNALLTAAGGLRATAGTRRIQIERILPPAARTEDGLDRVTVDVSAQSVAAMAQVRLEAGDVVRVFPVASRMRRRITVTGNVWTPGAQGFTPGMRLADALRLAGGVKPDVYLGRILITRTSRDSVVSQLRAAFADTTGALLENPALAEDDVIEVFSVRSFRPDYTVAITGAVRAGGQFPYRAGMTLRDLSLLAGGIDESAYLGYAEIARLATGTGQATRLRTAETIRVPLDSSYVFAHAGAERATDLPLLPHDNVLILRRPDWTRHREVVVLGEVRYPGMYSLRTRQERLSDLLVRAGGLTEEAYADGLSMRRAANTVGRIALDLPAVLRQPDHPDNLVLEHGDTLLVPAYSPVVTVKGAVNSPSSVAYVKGKDLLYYVRAAGGTTQRADLRRVYVTQANGKVEAVHRRRALPDVVPVPRPGSTVTVVEMDRTIEKSSLVQVLGPVAQVLGSLVAIIAAVAR